MKYGNSLYTLVLLLTLIHPRISWGQDIVTFGDVEAMARAGSANATDNSAITMNPATMALAQRYEIQGHLWITKGPDTSLAVGITDSKTSLVALGLVYQRQRIEGGQDSREWPGWVTSGADYARRKRFDNVTLALAVPVLERRLSFGLNGTLASYRHDVQGKGFSGNMDFGISGRPVDFFTMGISGRNLLPVSGCKNTQDSRPCIPDFDSGLLIGMYLGTPDFGSLGLDIDVHFTQADEGPPVSIRTGFQKAINKFNARAGYRWEGPTSEHWISLGFGMIEKNTGLGYAISIPLHPKPWDPLEMTHTITFRVAGIGSGPASEQPPGF